MIRSALKKAGMALGAILGVALIALTAMALTPVPRPTPEGCDTVTGRLTSVTSPGGNDVSLWLEGDEHRYYINRGIERGIDVAAWHERLHGKQVTLKVIRRNWSPLDPDHDLAPVAEVRDPEGVVFTVIENS